MTYYSELLWNFAHSVTNIVQTYSQVDERDKTEIFDKTSLECLIADVTNSYIT